MKRITLALTLLSLFTVVMSAQAYEDFWTQTNLKDTYVSTVVAVKDGYIYAGTSAGLFRSQDKGFRWEKIADFSLTICCIAQSQNGKLFVGTNDGLFRSEDQGQTWANVDQPFQSNWILTLVPTVDGAIYAGTYSDGSAETGGVYVTLDDGATWTPSGLSGRNINMLASRYQKDIYAVTDFGIYQLFYGTWIELAPQWTDSGHVAYTMAFTKDNEIIIGANDGLYNFGNDATIWRKLPFNSTNGAIKSVIFNSSNHLFIANSKEVFRSTDSGNTWMSVSTGLTELTYVNSLTQNFNDFLFAATFNGVYRTTSTTIPRISLEIPTVRAYVNHEVVVPIKVKFPWGFHFSSFEMKIDNYYRDKLEFLQVLIDSSILNAPNWIIQSHADSLLHIVGAGSYDLGGEGLFCKLRFFANDSIPGNAPLNFVEASFCECNDIYMEYIGGIIDIHEWQDGDVSEDGKLHPYDASLILKFLTGSRRLSTIQKELANVSGDSSISGLDASLVLQYIVGKVGKLPFTSGGEFLRANGNFNMVSRTLSDKSTVEIPIYARDVQNIYSYEAELSFNPAHLKYTKINYSNDLDLFYKEENVSDGKIKIAGSSTQALQSDGVVATIQFELTELPDKVVTQVNFDKLRLNEELVQQDVATAVIVKETAVGKASTDQPLAFELFQNYPNPFNPATIIQYQLPHTAKVHLSIYNVAGQLVQKLVAAHQPAGHYSVAWDASRVSAGLYFYEIQAGDFQSRKKCLLLK